jgi:hypothetical protein
MCFSPSPVFCASSRNVLITNRCLSSCSTSSTVHDMEGVPGTGVEGEVVLDTVPTSLKPREYRVNTGVLSPPTSWPEPSSSFTSRYTILQHHTQNIMIQTDYGSVCAAYNCLRNFISLMLQRIKLANECHMLITYVTPTYKKIGW